MKASDLLDPTHPLHKVFINFVGANQPTKRQARKFLQKFPQYTKEQEA